MTLGEFRERTKNLDESTKIYFWDSSYTEYYPIDKFDIVDVEKDKYGNLNDFDRDYVITAIQNLQEQINNFQLATPEEEKALKTINNFIQTCEKNNELIPGSIIREFYLLKSKAKQNKEQLSGMKKSLKRLKERLKIKPEQILRFDLKEDDK